MINRNSRVELIAKRGTPPTFFLIEIEGLHFYTQDPAAIESFILLVTEQRFSVHADVSQPFYILLDPQTKRQQKIS